MVVQQFKYSDIGRSLAFGYEIQLILFILILIWYTSQLLWYKTRINSGIIEIDSYKYFN